MESVAAGETFDVPRTALLLTGSVKSLLPLPAQFSAAVQNPHRTSSAADILWPSNISSMWDSTSESANSRPGHSSSEGNSTHSRQQSVPASSVSQSPAAAQQDLSGSGSSRAAAAQSGSISVVVHDGCVATPPKGSPAAAVGAGSSGADAGDPLLLVAPAELPPGEFKCIEEAMVLQVRGETCCRCTVWHTVSVANQIACAYAMAKQCCAQGSPCVLLVWVSRAAVAQML